jgi:PKD repeat protein
MTVCENLPAQFSLTATGTSLVYRWQVDKGNGSGFTNLESTDVNYSRTDTETLSVLSPTRDFNNYKYRALVSGTCNPAKTSSFAVLSINTAPEIVSQSGSQTICEFNSVSFSVNISGANVSYIWQEDSGTGFVDIEDVDPYIGSKTSTLSIFNVPREKNDYRYRVMAFGICNPAIVSTEDKLTVMTSPEITVNPADNAVCEDGTTGFSVTAVGNNLTYQWQVSSGGGFTALTNVAPYSGTSSANLLITGATTDMDGFKYRVRVSGACVPPVNSAEVILVVNPNPFITSNPSAVTICADENVSFFSGADGADIVYQWEVSTNNGTNWSSVTDDVNYSGSTTATLTLQNVPVSFNNNLYRLGASNACVAVNSASAKITVNEVPVINITGTGLFPIVCGGTDLTLSGNPTGGSGNYAHNWTGDVIPLSSLNTAQTVFNSSINGTYNLTYKVTDNATSCKASETLTITNDMPNAAFTSNSVPSCGFVMVDFTNTSTRAVSYEWDFDDGSAIETNPVSISHGFDNLEPLVKYFGVELTAISSNGCRNATVQYVTLYPAIDPAFTVAPAEGCSPVSATLLTQPGAAKYEWDFGDNQQESVGSAILHNFVNSTSEVIDYTVTLKTTSFYGCKAETTRVVKVLPMPVPVFSFTPTSLTFPETTVTIANLVSPGPWTYKYDFGDGTTSTLENPEHTYETYGSYNIVQRVSFGSCIDSITQNVIIQPALPIAEFAQPEPGCTPLTIEFENKSIYGETYRWDFGDGSISTKENPVYTYFDPGTFHISLRVTGGNGNTHTFNTTLEVYPTPILNFSYTPDSVYVNDKPIKFFNLSGFGDNYIWNFGDYDDETGEEGLDNISTEFEPVHVYHTLGLKDIRLIGSNQFCADTLLVEEAVLVRPAGKFIFPNVFRPDQNGPADPKWDKNNPSTVNSVFFPGVIDQVLEYHLYVYNRWGEQIFATDDITIGWNGYINGEIAKQGVYIWKVSGKYTNGKNFQEAGDVTLLY